MDFFTHQIFLLVLNQKFTRGTTLWEFKNPKFGNKCEISPKHPNNLISKMFNFYFSYQFYIRQLKK